MLSTIKLYDEDSFMKSFSATVVSCDASGDGYELVLDATAFFPEGGGQDGDTGTVECEGKSFDVTDTQIDNDGVIRYFISGYIAPGATVEGKVDFENRFDRMQNHSAEHIVSGLVHSEYGLSNIGFHLGDDDVTCDYNGSLTAEQIRHIEMLANEAIFANIPVLCEYPAPEVLSTLSYRSKLDIENNVRIVTIPGIDVCACCAPHVHSTGEIGLIKIVGHEKSHGGTRLHLCAGRRALADYNIKQSNIMSIVDLLSAPQSETAEAVSKLVEKNRELEHQISVERIKQAKLVLDGINETQGNLVVALKDAEGDALMALAKGGAERAGGIFVALTNAASGYRYIITSRNTDLRPVIKEANAALNGRGGGRESMVQGSFDCTIEEIREYFKA